MEKRQWYNSIFLIFSIHLFLLSLVVAQEKSTSLPVGDLKIDLQGLKNKKGVVLLSLFSSPAGFPADASKATTKLRVPLKQLQLPIVVKNMKTGTYAIALLHDEDENGKMLTSIIGLPKEGYGFSNNVIGLAGPPSFQKASFTLSDKGTSIILRVRY